MVKCSVCHRPLTDPISIRAGMGPECRGRFGASDGSDLCNRVAFSDTFNGSIPFREALVLGRQPRINMFYDMNDLGAVVTNIPHLVVHHSPDGFEFGYGGSGPGDLALNVCQLYLNMNDYSGQQTKCYDGMCWTLAWVLHHPFKFAFLAEIDRKGETIPFARIDAWFKSQLTSALLDQYQLQFIEE